MSLFVGNIPASVSARDLETLFGKVGKCKIDLRPGQKQSQFAFVVFDTEKDANSAVASLNQYQLAGNSLRVRFTSNHSTPAPEPASRSRSPSRLEKQIVNLAPVHPTVQKGVVTLQSIKAATGGSTVISLSGSKVPGERTSVVTLSPAKVGATIEPANKPPLQQPEVPVPPPTAAPAIALKPDQPKPSVPVKIELPKIEPKLEPVQKQSAEKKPEETKAVKPQAPTSTPIATAFTPTPAIPTPTATPTPAAATLNPTAATLKAAQPAAPQTTQPVPVPIPAVKPVPQKQEEDKAEEESPDPEGIINLPGRADEVKCLPCGKVFKKAARKAHVTSKSHQKSREVSKK